MTNVPTARRRRSLLALTLAASPSLAFAETSPNLLTNPGAETHSLAGWTSAGTSNPSVDNGTFDPGITPIEGSFDFYGGSGANGTLTQTITLNGFAPTFEQIGLGQVSFNASFEEQSLNQGTSDAAGVLVTVIQQSPIAPEPFSSGEVASTGGWDSQAVVAALNGFSTQIQYQMFFNRHSGNDLDAFIDDNSLTLFYPGTSWAGTGTTWNTGANWHFGLPVAGAPALLTSAGNGANVTFDGNFSGAGLTELYVDAANTTMTLLQSANAMKATTEEIGNIAKGAYVQSGGSNTLSQLRLGEYAGSTGTYSISNGTLSSSEIDVGVLGSGSFAVSGGAVSTINLVLALVGNSTANVTISGGSLAVTSNITISGANSAIHLTAGTLAVQNINFISPTFFSWTGGNLVVNANIDITSNSPLSSYLPLNNGRTFTAQQLSNHAQLAILSPSTLTAATLQNFGTFSNAGSIFLTSTQQSLNNGTFTSTSSFQTAGNFVNNGNFSLAGTQSWANGTTFTNSGNASFLTDAGSPTSFPLNLINSLNQTHLTGPQHLNAITINAGTVTIDSGTVKTNSLQIAGTLNNWTAALDLGANSLILQNPGDKTATINTLRNQILAGKTHPTGILAASLPANEALAVLDNAITQFTTFHGLDVNTDSLLLAPELLGDANADGHVDLTDLSTILNNFGTTTSAWTAGNFDNASTIDLTDLSDVLNNFGLFNPNAIASPLSTKDSALSTATPVPEPASLSLLLTSLLLARSSPFRRRRSAIPKRSKA